MILDLAQIKRDFWMAKAAAWLLLGLVLFFASIHAANTRPVDSTMHSHVKPIEWTNR